jgi:5-methylcytosine-specific restriction endonuclease McrA
MSEDQRRRIRESTARSYQKFAEERKASAREYRQTEMGRAVIKADRAKRRSATRDAAHGCVTGEAVSVIMALPCIYCGGPSEHLDHIYPLSKGGLHCVSNLAPACAPCNLTKRDTVLQDPPEPPLQCSLERI